MSSLPWLCLQISVVVMFLISIILYRAIVSLLVASSRDFRFVASVRWRTTLPPSSITHGSSRLARVS